MTEAEINKGICKVLFIMWGIPSILSIYKVMIDKDYDLLYIIIISINILIMLILSLPYICYLFNKPNQVENVNIGNDIVVNI